MKRIVLVWKTIILILMMHETSFCMNLKIGLLLPYEEFRDMQQVPLMIHSVTQKILSSQQPFIFGLDNVTFYERETKFNKIDGVKGARYMESKGVNAIIGHIGSSASEVITLYNTPLGIPSCSGGSTSPTLSVKDDFPYFFRTIPNDNLQGRALCDLVKFMNWKRIAVLAKADTYGQGLSSVALTYGSSIGLEIISSQLHPVTQRSFKDQLNVIKESGAKIIYLPQSSETEIILQDAWDMGMISKDYVYLITEPDMLFLRLEDKNLLHLAEGIITSQPTPSYGKVYNDYHQEWINYHETNFPGSPIPSISDYALFTIDCLYALLHGFKRLLENNSNSNITLENLVENRLGEYLKSPTFSQFSSLEGTTGLLKIDQNGDRIGDIIIENCVGGKLVEVGRWTDERVSLTKSIIFFGGQTQVPLDRDPPKGEFYLSYDDPVSIFIVIMTGIVIGFCILLFIGLTIHKENQVIKGSSYLFCILMVFGSLIGSLTIFTLIGRPNPYSCMARPWIMSLSYALVFCNLVGKTYRIHKIFNNEELQIITLTDRQLFVVASATILFEIIILTVWSVIDPLIPYNDSESNPFYTVIKCRSGSVLNQNIFIWLLISINLMIAIVGAYFAYRTRRVDENYKESKYIGMALYNVLILSVVFLSILNSGNATNELAKFIILSLGILMICFFTLSFIFIPKFVDILVFHRGIDSTHPNGSHSQSSQNHNQYRNQKTTKQESSAKIVPLSSHTNPNPNDEPSPSLELALKELSSPSLF